MLLSENFLFKKTNKQNHFALELARPDFSKPGSVTSEPVPRIIWKLVIRHVARHGDPHLALQTWDWKPMSSRAAWGHRATSKSNATKLKQKGEHS